MKEAGLTIPLQPDLFHLLQEARRLTRRLESAVYKALDNAERARRADLQARGIIRRQGRQLKIKVPLPQAELEEARAIECFDQWCWLLGEIRQVLEPITPRHTMASATRAHDTLETTITLLKELAHPDITSFADDLHQKIPALIAPLLWLEQQLTPLLSTLDADTQTSLIWAWQQRQPLNLDIDTDFPETLRPVVQTVWHTLDLFHRSSSLAESFHSWLRPYLPIHWGMPKWLLPSVQLCWNYHTFQRGKRAGSSPLKLAGVEDVLLWQKCWTGYSAPTWPSSQSDCQGTKSVSVFLTVFEPSRASNVNLIEECCNILNIPLLARLMYPRPKHRQMYNP